MDRNGAIASISINPTTGAVTLGYGASVALVVANQQWDVTLDPDTTGGIDAGTPFEAFEVSASVRSSPGAARLCLVNRNGNDIRISCVDPTTGALANVAAGDVVVVVRRSGVLPV